MTTKNEITGDALRNKPASDSYRENFDRIFRAPGLVEAPEHELAITRHADAFGLCDKCDPDRCCRS